MLTFALCYVLYFWIVYRITHRQLRISPTSFYHTRAWQRLRYKAIKRYGRTCAACKRTKIEVHVDHVLPRSKYPDRALDIKNLQILCRECNLGKGNWDKTKWKK